MTFLLHALSAVTLAVSPIGSPVSEFEAHDQHGRSCALSSFADSKVVVVAVLGTECPLAKLYGPRLQQLADEYSSKEVAVIGVNANSQDSMADIQEYAKELGIKFSILRDNDNAIVDQLMATRTPEVFVLDGNRVVRYHGRIDDQYGVGYVRAAPTKHDLRVAVEELLSGDSVSNSSTESVGCIIGRVKKPSSEYKVTYCNQISRLFQKHCAECHRDGDIGPFQMDDYSELVGWADMIAEVVKDRRMPPWSADPQHGKFLNARRLSPSEKQLIYDWVKADAPYGDESDLPAPRKFVDGWRLEKEPDAVFEMSKVPFRVPAEGIIEYQYFTVDPGFKEDQWIAAAEVVPGNRGVVHHSIVSVVTPDEWGEKAMSWLAAYVPGQDVTRLKSHQAYFVPAGSKLVFQLHYTPTGRTQTDVTRIGIVFADPDAVTERVFTMLAQNRSFAIPAHAANHRVGASLSKFPKEAMLLSLSPHMHLRGKSFRCTIRRDKESSILLDVPDYDYNWQHTYQLERPIALDAQTRILCEARYDNSASNPTNPDPSRTVRWGEQSEDEMMLTYCSISVPVDPKTIQPPETAETPESRLVKKTVDRFFKRFDKDNNGRLVESELPKTFGQFAFRNFDANRDGAIDRAEATVQAEKSVKNRATRRRR
ncbi:MAG: redoxin domain-containing protein [Planctomycetales bacterium]|nr:redoxin domain-containing protein [Planctomycetales bacterium]